MEPRCYRRVASAVVCPICTVEFQAKTEPIWSCTKSTYSRFVDRVWHVWVLEGGLRRRCRLCAHGVLETAHPPPMRFLSGNIRLIVQQHVTAPNSAPIATISSPQTVTFSRNPHLVYDVSGLDLRRRRRFEKQVRRSSAAVTGASGQAIAPEPQARHRNVKITIAKKSLVMTLTFAVAPFQDSSHSPFAYSQIGRASLARCF